MGRTRNQKRKDLFELFDEQEYKTESEEWEPRLSGDESGQEIDKLETTPAIMRNKRPHRALDASKTAAITPAISESNALTPLDSNKSKILEMLKGLLLYEGFKNPKITKPGNCELEDCVNYEMCKTLPCLFTKCSKEFQQHNGLQYHLTNNAHSLDDILESDVEISPEMAESRQRLKELAVDFNGTLLILLNFKFKSRKSHAAFKLKIEKKAPVIPRTPTNRLRKDKNPVPVEEVSFGTDSTYATFDTKLEECISRIPDEKLEILISHRKERLSKSLGLFDSFCINGCLQGTVNVGLSATKVAWCPNPSIANCFEDYLAVGGNFGKTVYSEINELDSSTKSQIQIWKLVLGEQLSISLQFNLETDNGTIVDMQWCPNGCYDAAKDRLGILATVFGDGSLKLYNIPLFGAHEEKVGKTFAFDEIFEFKAPTTCITAIEWGPNDFLAAGCANEPAPMYAGILFAEMDNTIKLLRPGFENRNAAGREKALEYDISGGKASLVTHSAAVWKISMSKYSTFVLSASADGSIKIGDIAEIFKKNSAPYLKIVTVARASNGVVSFAHNDQKQVEWNPNKESNTWFAYSGVGWVRVEKRN
ncbi:General transcription factor 3C polypeptide 2 [Terramyces sp. JEL0728]|nr:General transcription factor 3C polypeptide 2 [Terramyces sp. JEL0728]